jgi:hypothetical protein
MNVYLISDSVYIAAESEQSARELGQRQEGCEANDDCQVGNDHNYWEDACNRENGQEGDSSMIEAAQKKLTEGEKLPFVVAYSLDCI